MSMRALASPRLWTRGSRAALSIGVKQHVVAYSTNKRSQYQAISPSMRQAMAHDNSGIRQKYVEQSLSHLGTDITVMEPRQIAHLIRLCSRVGKLEDALTIYSEGIKLKKVTSHVVETALKACFECNDPDSTDKVIGLATEAGVELDHGVIATLQSGFTDCLRLDLAYETFIASREKGYPMDMKDNNLLAALIKAGNATHAAEVLKAMYNTREQYGLPDDETWTQAAKAAASVKNPQFLMDLIKEAGDEPARAGRFSAAFYTHLICGSASVDPNLGWDLYLKSKESGIVGGVQHYHLIMSAFIKAKQNHAVPTIYEDMKALGVLPDETTYIVVISSFVKLSQYTKINETLDEMRQRGVTPNIQLYTVVFDNLARMGEIKASFGVLEQMRIDNLKPSAEMWSSLMRSMARAIQYERAQGTLDRLKTAQMENVSYRSLLHTLSHIRRGEYSTSALDELKSSGMSFDENLRNAMIILTEEEDGSNMEAILAQMKAANVVPDEGIFNFLMDSAVRSRNVDQVRRIMNRMEEYKIKPSEVTWNIYMRGLGLAGLAEEILKIWDTKFTEGKKNLIDYNTIIHLMVRCNRLDMVAKMFNEMNQSGIEPNEITANILIQGYGRAQQLDKCFQIFDAFKAKYGLLTAVSYNMLVWSCLFNKRPEKAIAVFDDMNNSGVTPLSSLGWDAANEGIKNIVKLEESWDNIQKQPTALENSVNLVKLCVQCNRPDLVQRVVNLSHQNRLIATPKDTNTKEEDNSAGVAWEAVDKFLDSKERETIRSWVTDGRMSMEETEIQNMKFKNKSPRGRYPRNDKTDEAKAEAVKEEKKEDAKEEVKIEETKEEEKKDEEKKDEEKKEL